MIFLYFRLYPEEDEGRRVSSCVIRREEPRSCCQEKGNIIYSCQSIQQRCILLVRRWWFPVLMDGVSWMTPFPHSSLLINIYFKIENIFHLSVLIVCFIYFKLNIFLCIISLPIKMMIRDVNNPLISLLVFFNRKK